MKLDNPITIVPPSLRNSDGTIKNFDPIVLNELNLIIIDDVKGRTASVYINNVPRPLVLWKGEAYDAAGDYTQSDVENRVIELLGSDPKAILEGLFTVMLISPPKIKK